MWRTLSLVLPVLIPSWRFFKAIEPAPRVEWTLLSGPNARPGIWHPFRPKPDHMGAAKMLRRLFWNPDGNEALFVVSCAERIHEDPTPHSIAEIEQRILADVRHLPEAAQHTHIQFRLRFVHRQKNRLVDSIVFTSTPTRVAP